MKNICKQYKRDENGNFAIIFAICIGILVLAIAVVIETSRMYGARTALQDMADSAALSGAYIAKTDIAGRDKTVRESIKFHQAYVPDMGLANNATVKFDDVNEEVSVTVPRTFSSFFGGILGQDKIVVSAKSIVSYRSEALDPVSIAFALDVSGSMGANTNIGAIKIDVLKQSTKLLFNELEAGAARPDLLVDAIRTGMSAYNTDVVSTQMMGWGWTHLENAVDNLVAAGGTNSTPALENAYDQLKFDRAFRASDDSKFQQHKLREYVVFMTDGDNNQPVWDDESAAMCRVMRGEGIEIYSIAFTAPEKGQLLLLDCASYDSGVEPDAAAAAAQNDKCMNNGSQGKGKALGHCKDKWDEKSKYYFDADDAAAFKDAFASIGKEIAQNTIRVVG